MTERELVALTAAEAAARVRRREVSAVELTRAALERIERLQPQTHAFITVTAERALAEAVEVDRTTATGAGDRTLPLAGVPLTVKDLYETKGVRTTAGSRVLAEHVTERDATVVARLRAAGAVLVGKTSLHEFAFGFTNDNPHYGRVPNPWDPERIPGGSSGGSAVAVATSMCLASLGSDTGGSIRMPAALTNTVGFKPTYGRVSRHGVMALSWSMDHVGPMTKTARDAAVMLRVIAGHDPNDDTSSTLPVADYPSALTGDIRGVRIGIPHNHFFENLEPEVARVTAEAIKVLKARGAELADVTLPHLDQVVAAHRAIIFSEAASYHAKLIRNHAAEYGDDVRPLIQSGFFFTAAQYLDAQKARRRIIDEWRAAMSGVQCLVTPTCPVAATKWGATTATVAGVERPLVRVYLDHTLPFDLTGQPAISVPCGFTSAGLPVGLQLVGKPWEEELILRVADAYERETKWYERLRGLPRG